MGVMSFDAEPIPAVVEFINRHYKGGTVLDFGCGCGRYTDCFDATKYLGVDGYEDNIKTAKKLHPRYKFEVHDLETWKPDKKFDYLFSSVVFEEVKNKPKGWAKTYILIEPYTYAGFTPIIDKPLNYSTVHMMVVKEENEDSNHCGQ